MTYEQKFSGLIAAIASAKTEGADVLTVTSAETLGDDYEELIESLKSIARAGIALGFTPAGQRGRVGYARN